MPHPPFGESYGSNPAENYERFFVPAIGKPLADQLLGYANVQPTERVLDVACGTGIVARLLSEVIGPEGSLAGLDSNASMLAVARSVAPPSAKIHWHEASAEDMPFPAESCDVVLCQMGLQFMSDRSAALGEVRRVLRAPGRLLLSVPGPLTGIFANLASAMERHVGPQAAGFVEQVFSLHDVDEVERLLQDAGFSNMRVEVTNSDLELAPPRQFLWQYIHSTPLSGVVSQVDAGTLLEFEQEVLAAWANSVRGDELTQRVRMVVASATKSAA